MRFPEEIWKMILAQDKRHLLIERTKTLEKKLEWVTLEHHHSYHIDEVWIGRYERHQWHIKNDFIEHQFLLTPGSLEYREIHTFI